MPPPMPPPTQLWMMRCSGCEKPWTIVVGKDGGKDDDMVCVTPGCKYQNLSASKAMERGWTPALPFTECKCPCNHPTWIMGLDGLDGNCVQRTDQPHNPECPLYEEPKWMTVWKMKTVGWKPVWKTASEWKAGDSFFGIPVAPYIPCTLCKGEGGHADSCPAQPGHTCKHCDQPIQIMTYGLYGLYGGGTPIWVHDSPNAIVKCGKAAEPKATKLTGVCVHGNPRVTGCQACDSI